MLLACCSETRGGQRCLPQRAVGALHGVMKVECSVHPQGAVSATRVTPFLPAVTCWVTRGQLSVLWGSQSPQVLAPSLAFSIGLLPIRWDSNPGRVAREAFLVQKRRIPGTPGNCQAFFRACSFLQGPAPSFHVSCGPTGVSGGDPRLTLGFPLMCSGEGFGGQVGMAECE